MCFTQHDRRNVRVVKEDLLCYKVVNVRTLNGKETIVSHHMDFQYEIGKKYTKDFWNALKLRYGIFVRKYRDGTREYNGEGFHSFVNIRYRLLEIISHAYHGDSVAICVIPKGSILRFNPHSRDQISSAIKILFLLPNLKTNSHVVERAKQMLYGLHYDYNKQLTLEELQWIIAPLPKSVPTGTASMSVMRKSSEEVEEPKPDMVANYLSRSIPLVDDDVDDDIDEEDDQSTDADSAVEENTLREVVHVSDDSWSRSTPTHFSDSHDTSHHHHSSSDHSHSSSSDSSSYSSDSYSSSDSSSYDSSSSGGGY